MIGWGVSVYPSAAAIDGETIVCWRTGATGLGWLDELAQAGRAADHGGGGYPMTYSMPATTLFAALDAGAHLRNSPTVIGDDYVLPENWQDDLDWRRDRSSIPPDQILTIQAWDLS